jgi:methyl-accepting chemotaxis protein
MTASVRLARSSAEIASIAPALLAAHDTKERDATLAALEADEKSLQQAIDEIAAGAGSGEATGALRGAARQMAVNLAGLAEGVRQRLKLDGEIAAVAAQVRSTHNAIETALAPLVDDASFDLVTGLQNAASYKDPAATQQHLSDLANKQVVALQAMSDLRADSNLVLGLLTEGAGVPSKDLFPPLLDRFNAAANHLEKSLAALGNDKSASALHQPVEELLQFGRGDKSLFALRRAELDASAAGEAALVANHRLAGTLEDAVSQIVAHSESAAKTAATTTDVAISRGRVLLISDAVASLLVALVIGAFYIGRSVARRLSELRNSMAEIAGGNFDATIPAGGHDEIAEMASALIVFRDTGRTAREAEAAAAAERRRLEGQRRTELLSLADAFETTVKSVVDTVSGAASEMQLAAASLAKTADHSSRQASVVAAASTEASANVQRVATAAEELSNSTAEIARQVSESAEVAARAVAETERTNATVKGLAESAHRIKDVVSLINNIASQTKAGTKRHDRSGARRRSGQGLRGRRLGGEGAGNADRKSHRRHRGASRCDTRGDPGRSQRYRRNQPDHQPHQRNRHGRGLVGRRAERDDTRNRAERPACRPGDTERFRQYCRRHPSGGRNGRCRQHRAWLCGRTRWPGAQAQQRGGPLPRRRAHAVKVSRGRLLAHPGRARRKKLRWLRRA